MQKSFFANFTDLEWHIEKLTVVTDNIVEIDFIFKGNKIDGEHILKVGKELIVVSDEGLIQHIEVRSN